MIVVLCHGTFDLLHIGHMRMFEHARTLGDRLVVTLTADAYVAKGPGRPIYNEEERAYAIRKNRDVSEVDIVYERTGLASIKKHHPDIYLKGGDYKPDEGGMLGLERRAVESYGGKLVIFNEKLMSSSSIIARVAKWQEAQHAHG
jgi:rfaE bifunctional protein nucleotidyltransferase chain/domain